MADRCDISTCLKDILNVAINPLDLVPRGDLAEKLIELALYGTASGLPIEVSRKLEKLAGTIRSLDTSDARVVVLGGGTGLSNIIGGDSRRSGWPQSPFQGLKKIFPKTTAITCITDDGGSTGELVKELPVVALGDIRHVLLSSIQEKILREHYGLSASKSVEVVSCLHALFNYRLTRVPASVDKLVSDSGARLEKLPDSMRTGLSQLLSAIFSDHRLKKVLKKSQCLGNLILAASIYSQVSPESETVPDEVTVKGICRVSELVGAAPDAVLPCATTPARLQVLYSNGVLVTGEHKSSVARRGYPIERVFVQFTRTPYVPSRVIESIKEADILIFAPGSLFTSLIPILHVPHIANAVRKNTRALKILVANLWAQEGETDMSRDDPSRRFYVSDLIAAYSRNIPGGIKDLFQQVLVLGLQDIPGSVLQSYAVENKIPIYLDSGRVQAHGLKPVEAGIFSEQALRERHVVQHCPRAFSIAVQTIWAARNSLDLATDDPFILPPEHTEPHTVIGGLMLHERLKAIKKRLSSITVPDALFSTLIELFWHHKDILPAHLDFVKGIELLSPDAWPRSQEWDNILSFYDPHDSMIKIRSDIVNRDKDFETAFLVALGESLLGNYSHAKAITPLEYDGRQVGKIFRLEIEPEDNRTCFLTSDELDRYLCLARLSRDPDSRLVYTRVINASEGFTPPGLLFGLIYTWYLDNRLAGHIEYKMSIMKSAISDLIPEQIKMLRMRKAMIEFFRKVVFKLDDPGYC